MRFGLAIVVVLTAAAVGAGCGVVGLGGENMSADEQRQTLRERPDIEQISARYERMQAVVRERLSAEIGLIWVNDDNSRGRGCGFEFADVPEAQSKSLSRWTAEANLPDAQWPTAAAVVQEVTGQHGFGTPEVVVDRPGDHRIVVPDPYGGTLTFGTAAATILSMHTGCHLPPDEPHEPHEPDPAG